jgi:tetratricopeptide (TPR) repeat protein
MEKMKLIKEISSLTVAVLLSIGGVSASSNEKGIDLYRAELYNAAKLFFLKQQNQSPQEQAENYYYLGQTYYQLQQTDSAAYYYERAIQADLEYPFGYIGEGKLALAKGDAKTAESLFKKANGLAKKDPSIQTTIAEVYINANRKTEAEEALDKARKVNKKYSGIYVAEGDMLMKNGKTGDACARYENAIAFDKNDKVAYLKLARVYKNINTSEALRYLDELTGIDPEYIPAYAEIGDLYDLSSTDETNVNYTKALAAYEKFISIPGVPLLQHERYARLLYFTNQYEKSLREIDRLLQENPNNPVMNRLKAYNNYKLENNALALAEMADFLQNNPADKHIYPDYITYGRLLLKEKQPESAIDAFLKAAALDPEKSEVYKELVNAYEALNNYPEAINQYEKYFAIEKSPVVFDYFYYGQANYSAASKYIDAEYLEAPVDPEQKALDDEAFKSYIEKGNSAFSEVISRSPESYIGYLWRARLNSFVDVKEQKAKGSAMQGAAKPFYEETLTVMLATNEDGKRNNEIIEAYRYLASYYLLLDDKINAGDYFKKILEIEPDNAVAKDALTQLKIKF